MTSKNIPQMPPKRCGYIALIGRPNVGKSTLLNALVGEKVSIVSPKAQTTRHKILGIYTESQTQFIFVDTPGIHQQNDNALNRTLNQTAAQAAADVDLILFMVETNRWTDADQAILDQLKDLKIPLGLIINKIDLMDDRTKLLPHLEKLNQGAPFLFSLPICSKVHKKRESYLKQILQECEKKLPESEFLYPEEDISDRSLRFMMAETIREKLFHRLNAELPYHLTVEIEQYKRDGNLLRLAAVIWVARDSHKGMVIGANGAVLKEVGERARRELEARFETKIFLQLWVKVKENWNDDVRSLERFGYGEKP